MKFSIQEVISPHSRVLSGQRNESRKERNQEIQGLKFLNNSIAQNIEEYNTRRRERIYNILKLGKTIISSP